MPLFYFHVRDGRDNPDREGVELPDVASARVNGVRLTGEMLKEHAEGFWADREWELTVSDSRRLTLFTLLVIGELAPAARM